MVYRYQTFMGGSAKGAGAMANYMDRERVPESPDRTQALYYQNERNPDGLRPNPPEFRQDVHPSVAAFLGIDPTRTPTIDEIAHLFEGNRADGAELPSHHSKKISYVDMVFSADKSLSVAWALAETDAERQILQRAHVEAADDAMAYVAGELGRKRKGQGGKDGHEAGHIAWTRFDHYTARPVVKNARTDENGRPYTEMVEIGFTADPQIHSHYSVPNVVVTEDGKVGSLDLRRLEGRVKEFGAYYHARLATVLRRDGISVGLDEKTGSARLDAIPSFARDSYSKRRLNGTDVAREFAAGQGKDWDALSEKGRNAILQTAMRETRQRKNPSADYFAEWRKQAKEIHYNHRSVLRPDAIQPLPDREMRRQIAYEAAQPLWDAELQRRAVLTGADARVLACRGLIASGVQAPAEIDHLTAEFRERGVVQDGSVTKLIWAQEAFRRGPDRTSITTALHEDQETEFVSLVKAAHADRRGALTSEMIGRAADASGMDFTTEHGKRQRAVMDGIGTGGRFSVAIGVAGAGKSAMLKPLADAWRAQGRDVIGVALAWRQTEALADAGIETRAALAKFLHPSFQTKHTLDRNTVVAVDEIGQVGTRQMLTLLRLQKEKGFSIVAFGDDKQCASIEAGPVIGLMGRALGEDQIPAILSSIRQQTERERETALMFRQGRAGEALAIKQADGTAQLVAGDYRAAVERVAALWQERMVANRDKPDFRLSISAPSNKEARDIGAAIRAHRRTMGEVGPDQLVLAASDQTGQVYDLPLAVGDRVRLFSKPAATFTDGRGGRGGTLGSNGKVLDVTGISEDGLKLRMPGGREGWVKFSALTRDAGRSSARPMLTYGDALTIDATQGITSTEHINALPSGTRHVNGFKGYVAASRHRLTTWMVVGEGAERQEIAERRSFNDPRPITEADVWKNMARNLERQPMKDSALAFLERAHGIRRSAAVGLQRGLHPGQQRAARGEHPATIGQRLGRIRTALVMARTVEHVGDLARKHGLSYRRVMDLGPRVKRVIDRGVRRSAPGMRIEH